jgi:hypothetical protein
MQRRDILKMGGLAGLSLLLPWGSSSKAHADAARFAGPYFLHIHAAGGWDPALFCDGKIAAKDGQSILLDNDAVTKVELVNNVPVPTVGKDGGQYALLMDGVKVENPSHFFQNQGKKFRVFNGVDAQTNNHETGMSEFGCGHNTTELPALAAMYAGKIAETQDVPMAFLAGGVYNYTGDVVALSRFDRDRIRNIAYPNRNDPNNVDSRFLPDLALQEVQKARAARIEYLTTQNKLPRSTRTLNAHREALLGGSGLSLLADVLKDAELTFDQIKGMLPFQDQASLDYLNNGNRLVNVTRPIESILRCFAAGISVSATYAMGGFDTHDNHDTNQMRAMSNFVLTLRYAMQRAQDLGIGDKLFVLVTSDFGRTPRYNTNNKGKDHWNVTSALVSGPGISGGCIGASDESHKPKRVSKADPRVVVEDKDTTGLRIRASHIHRELRRVLGVDQVDFAKKYPLPTGTGEDALGLLT